MPLVFIIWTSRDDVRVWPKRWKRSRGSRNVPWQAVPSTSHNIWSLYRRFCEHGSHGGHFEYLLCYVWDSGHVVWATALRLMFSCSAIYCGNYAFPDTRWYALWCSTSSQQSPLKFVDGLKPHSVYITNWLLRKPEDHYRPYVSPPLVPIFSKSYPISWITFQSSRCKIDASKKFNIG